VVLLRLWIDVVTPGQSHLFHALIPEFRERISCISSTDFAETNGLLRNFGIKPSVIGRHLEQKSLRKYLKVFERLILLTVDLKTFDVSLSFQNFYAPLAAKLRGITNISLFDNDLPSFDVVAMLRFSDYLICPRAIPIQNLIAHGADRRKIYQFDGYKEDIYLADFVPDSAFLKQLPFDHYVVVRPEALFAVYVHEKKTIVPELLSLLEREGFGIVYLPRCADDLKYVSGTSAYVPSKPLNGLDLCWHSKAVLTGSGTLAREAACMGVPAVSFFPEKLISVDERLAAENSIFHTRHPSKIIDYIHKNLKKDRCRYPKECKKVKAEVVLVLNKILSELEAELQ
jgi:predicted glycosyltransferase